jgi:hypothetical protein
MLVKLSLDRKVVNSVKPPSDKLRVRQSLKRRHCDNVVSPEVIVVEPDIRPRQDPAKVVYFAKTLTDSVGVTSNENRLLAVDIHGSSEG